MQWQPLQPVLDPRVAADLQQRGLPLRLSTTLQPPGAPPGMQRMPGGLEGFADLYDCVLGHQTVLKARRASMPMHTACLLGWRLQAPCMTTWCSNQ